MNNRINCLEDHFKSKCTDQTHSSLWLFKCLGVNEKLAFFQSPHMGVPDDITERQEASKLGQHGVLSSSVCLQELFYWMVLSPTCPLWVRQRNKLLLCMVLTWQCCKYQNILCVHWFFSWFMGIKHVWSQQKQSDSQQKQTNKNTTHTKIYRINLKIHLMN